MFVEDMMGRLVSSKQFFHQMFEIRVHFVSLRSPMDALDVYVRTNMYVFKWFNGYVCVTDEGFFWATTDRYISNGNSCNSNSLLTFYVVVTKT